MHKSLQSCPTLYNPMDCICPWDSPGKNIGVDCNALLQGIFPIHEQNLHLICLLHWQAGSFALAPRGKPIGSQRYSNNWCPVIFIIPEVCTSKSTCTFTLYFFSYLTKIKCNMCHKISPYFSFTKLSVIQWVYCSRTTLHWKPEDLDANLISITY